MQSAYQALRIPQSVYIDKHSTYKSTTKQSVEDELENNKPMIQLERSLSELGVTAIDANSPQAKGRVERRFRTLQKSSCQRDEACPG